jgi:putative MATE family efflux protein
MTTELLRRLPDETPILLPAPPERPHNIRKEVWQIAWPSVLTFSLMTTNGILDRIFVGKLGSDALAAVGVGGQIMFLLISLSMAITTGTTALVARFTGAEEPEQATRSTGQSIALGLISGLFCTVAVYAAINPLLNLMRLSPAAQDQCRAFLHMALYGMIPMFVANVLGAAFRGLGDTRSPLKVMLCINVVHILGDMAFMLGYFGAPKLGLRGGGIALSFSSVVSLVVYLILLKRSPLADSLRWRHLKLTMEWAERILKIGIPAAFTALLRVTSLMAFTSVLARTAEKTLAVAALPIGMTAESIAFMPGFGFSVAASALVGQSLGARDPERAERYGWAATWQAVGIMSFMGAVFFLAAEPFTRLFTHDPVVVGLAVSYMRIMAISEPMLAFGMVLTGGLQGAGETVKPTIVTAVSFWLFRLPLAWLLAIVWHHNAMGAWVSMSLTTVVAGAWSIVLFRDGRWKLKKV